MLRQDVALVWDGCVPGPGADIPDRVLVGATDAEPATIGAENRECLSWYVKVLNDLGGICVGDVDAAGAPTSCGDPPSIGADADQSCGFVSFQRDIPLLIQVKRVWLDAVAKTGEDLESDVALS